MFELRKEPWCDVGVQGVMREAARAAFYPEGRALCLSGEWMFKLLPSPLMADAAEISRAATPENGYAPIAVPRSWQFAGYGRFQYTDEDFPFPLDPPYVPAANDTGVYKRSFDWDGGAGERVFLRFEGAESCLMVYVNGSFAGLSKGSRLPSEFEISSLLRPGENALCCVVAQYCDGSYLEDQDMWWLGGLMRDAYLLRRPRRFFRDLWWNADFDCATGRGLLSVHAEIEGGGLWKLRLEDGSGVVVLEAEAGKTAEFAVENAASWNPEEPRLYRLTACLPEETVRGEVGFRRVSIEAGVLKVNGRRVMLRGANRHEFSPVNGRAVSREETLKDIERMKDLGLNALRTAHYPNNPFLYEFCDRLGLFVIDECDLETHGFEIEGIPGRLANDPSWEEAYLDRLNRTIRRDRSHACVIIWSLGNESSMGKNFESMYAFAKRLDPTRPVHYEPDREGIATDIGSTMYTSVADLAKIDAEEKARPHILCEFAHAMGNGPGGLREYIDLIESSRRVQGYFIWEWRDHGVKRVRPDGKTVCLYGGEFGEAYHSGNFCLDGMLASDGAPTPGYYAYEKAVEPVRILETNWADGSVRLRSRLFFRSVKGAVLRAELKRDGVRIASGETALPDIAPGAEAVAKLPGELSYALKDNALYTIALAVTEAGRTLGRAGEVLREYLPAKAPACGAPRWERTPTGIKVFGEDFRLELSLIDGGIRDYLADGKRLLSSGPIVSFSRAYIDNDKKQRARWEKLHVNSMSMTVKSARAREEAGALVVEFTGSLGANARNWRAPLTIRYRIDAAGRVAVGIDGKFEGDFGADPADELPRIGTDSRLDASLRRITYEGFGPGECYVDSLWQARKDLYTVRVDELAFPYERPQESGNRTGVDWAALTDEDGAGLAFSSLTPLDMNAKTIDDSELMRAAHIADARKSGSILFRFDRIHSGLGSGSCGPDHLDAYRAYAKPFALRFALAPVRGGKAVEAARSAQEYLNGWR